MSEPPDFSGPGTGEFALIDWFRRQAAHRPIDPARVPIAIGDDCAALRFTPGREVLVTTDMLMDGRHFRSDRHPLEAIGRKAMGVNLSDIAAMAGVPVAAVVAVALPRRLNSVMAADVARQLFLGMQAVAREFDVALVGGDTNAWDGPLVICVTVLGEATGRGPVRRSGARSGDVVFVTGPLGGSLMADLHGPLPRHLAPRPRIREALALHETADLHAMIDISDGLAADLGHILEESGRVGAVLEADAIPIHDDAYRDFRAPAVEANVDVLPCAVPPSAPAEAGDSESARRRFVHGLRHALHDGEDFELCFTVGPEDATRLLAEPPKGVTLYRIGTITAEPGLRLRYPDGRTEPIEPKGFDHLRDAGGPSP
jgi:thiamine-monophosphate kinase